MVRGVSSLSVATPGQSGTNPYLHRGSSGLIGGRPALSGVIRGDPCL